MPASAAADPAATDFTTRPSSTSILRPRFVGCGKTYKSAAESLPASHFALSVYSLTMWQWMHCCRTVASAGRSVRPGICVGVAYGGLGPVFAVSCDLLAG